MLDLCLLPSSAAGEVIKPDAFKRINEEGMPIHGRPFVKGNLYIHFTVEFPDRLDPELVTQLRALGLPSNVKPDADDMDVDDAHEVTMATVNDIESELRSRVNMHKGSGEAYGSDSDDDMPRGGQRVQCAQQ